MASSTQVQSQDVPSNKSTPQRVLLAKEPLIKVITFLKRKKGMSREEFHDYYENNHCKLFDKYLVNPGFVRYVRRYVTPVADAISGEVQDIGFDVIMEIWLDDREVYESWVAGTLFSAEFREFVAKEEEHLFDREKVHMCVVEEYDSVLPHQLIA